jgi:hypothetical protein
MFLRVHATPLLATARALPPITAYAQSLLGNECHHAFVWALCYLAGAQVV